MWTSSTCRSSHLDDTEVEVCPVEELLPLVPDVDVNVDVDELPHAATTTKTPRQADFMAGLITMAMSATLSSQAPT